MELFGDLSSYNAAATLRVSSTLKDLDEVLYKHDFSCADLNKDNAVDARSRSIRNPLLLMFRRVCDFFDYNPLKSSVTSLFRRRFKDFLV